MKIDGVEFNSIIRFITYSYKYKEETPNLSCPQY